MKCKIEKNYGIRDLTFECNEIETDLKALSAEIFETVREFRQTNITILLK